MFPLELWSVADRIKHFRLYFLLISRTLPNWTDLKSSREKVIAGAENKLIKAHNLYMTTEEESPTQVQQRNIREAEMLTSNLGEGFITHQEILSEIGVLKELAILQESMVHNLKMCFTFFFILF